MTEIFYPNDDKPERPERPVESLLDDVDHWLTENTNFGETLYTVEQIAAEQGIENLKGEVLQNKGLQRALEKFIDLNEMEAFKVYENRADANFLGLLFSQVQKGEEVPK